MAPKASAPPTVEQARYHRWLLENVQSCEACGYFGSLATHHLLADAPGKQGRRDHFYVCRICHPCHNGRTDSVHLLGSEAKFQEHHTVDLVAISVARLGEYRDG